MHSRPTLHLSAANAGWYGSVTKAAHGSIIPRVAILIEYWGGGGTELVVSVPPKRLKMGLPGFQLYTPSRCSYSICRS